MLSSSDTLHELLARFASMVWSMASKSTVYLTLPDYGSSIQVRFLKLSGNFTVINYTFTFCTINCFGCFHSIISQFKCINHVPELDYSHLCSFQITLRVKQCTMFQCTNYHATIKNSGYLPSLEFWSCNICAVKKHIQKYCKTLDSTS